MRENTGFVCACRRKRANFPVEAKKAGKRAKFARWTWESDSIIIYIMS